MNLHVGLNINLCLFLFLQFQEHVITSTLTKILIQQIVGRVVKIHSPKEDSSTTTQKEENLSRPMTMQIIDSQQMNSLDWSASVMLKNNLKPQKMPQHQSVLCMIKMPQLNTNTTPTHREVQILYSAMETSLIIQEILSTLLSKQTMFQLLRLPEDSNVTSQKMQILHSNLT